MNPRMVRIAVSMPFFLAMCMKGWRSKGFIECVEGLPSGAQWVGQSFDEQRQILYFHFVHESFEPVLYGHEIPILAVEFREGMAI